MSLKNPLKVRVDYITEIIIDFYFTPYCKYPANTTQTL